MRGVRHLLALGTAAVCGALLYCLRLRFPNPLTEALGPANPSPWATGNLVFWAMPPAAAEHPAKKRIFRLVYSPFAATSSQIGRALGLPHFS